MARTTTIKDEQILDAARAEFLSKGAAATTAEIAKRAGVAEGSIFNRFRTKQDLFQAAMEARFEEPEWLAGLERRLGRGDVQEGLVELGVEIIEFFRRILPLAMLCFSQQGGGEMPAFLTKPTSPPLRVLAKVTRFFEAEMRAGRLAKHEPEVLARAYIGSLHNYVFLDLVTQGQQKAALPAERYARGLVKLL